MWPITCRGLTLRLAHRATAAARPGVRHVRGDPAGPAPAPGRDADLGQHETAIEVETTAKPLDQYLPILDAYADHGVAAHWYAVPPVAQERILHAAAVLDVRDLVRVWDWPPATARRD